MPPQFVADTVADDSGKGDHQDNPNGRGGRQSLLTDRQYSSLSFWGVSDSPLLADTQSVLGNDLCLSSCYHRNMFGDQDNARGFQEEHGCRKSSPRYDGYLNVPYPAITVDVRQLAGLQLGQELIGKRFRSINFHWQASIWSHTY